MADPKITSSIAYGVYRISGSTQEGKAGRADYYNEEVPPVIGYNIANIDGLTADPKVFCFPNANGEGRILVSETQYGPQPTLEPYPSLFSVYDENLVKVWPRDGDPRYPDGKAKWGALINVYAISRSGNEGFIYGIDYDRSMIFRIINDPFVLPDSSTTYDEYLFDGAAFVYDDNDSRYEQFGVDVYYDGENVYGLFIRGENVFGGQHTNSAIVKLNGNLSSPPAAKNETLAKNAIAIKTNESDPNDGNLYIASIGGAQHYDITWNGAASKIQSVAKSNLAVTDLVRSAADSTEGVDYDQTDFHDFDISATGAVFILKGKYYDSWGTFEAHVIWTTIAALKAGGGGLLSGLTPKAHYANDPDDSLGFFWALACNDSDSTSAANSYAWVVMGNLDDFDTLYMFKSDGTNLTSVANISIADLSAGGFSFNSLAPLNDLVQIRGAKHHFLASNSPAANEAKAKALADVKAVRTMTASKRARAAARASVKTGIEEEK